MAGMSVGILGVGAYLPEEIRQNDWFPAEAVETWPKKMAAVLARATEDPEFPVTDGVRKVIDGLRAYTGDPFFGIHARRVMPQGMKSSDMEIRAAREAI